MVKAKLYRQNHTQSVHIHTHKKRKREKYIYIYHCSQSPPPQFAMIRCLFRYSRDVQGTLSWLWRFSLLLLRLLGEISLSLLCLRSSGGSALDLDLPLRVGRLRVSVLHSDRTGLKEQLIRGLWLTQARGGRGTDAGRACGGRGWSDVAPAWGAPCVLPGKLSPDHGTLAVARCTGSQEGRCGEWPVLAHRLLGGGSSSLSVSCPSLGSTLIATARTCLWSSFKRRSESPLLAQQETKRQDKVSCLFGSSRPFPGLPPG